MRSWRPRAPSAQLEQRLFGNKTALTTNRPARAGWVEWVSWLFELRHALPAAGGLAVVICLALVGQAASDPSGPGSGFPVLAALSNQSWSAYLGTVEVHRNSVLPILGWTNGEHFRSTDPSLDQLYTNDLLPKL
jgi:hypothetical protein